MSSPSKDSADFDHDEHSLSSPTSPGFNDSASGGEAVPLADDPVEREKQITEWTEELEKVEGEMAMLRQVLGSKVRRANQLKVMLGITPFQEFKHDLQSGISHLMESPTYVKTNDTLHDWNDKLTHSSAYQKTSAVVKTASEKTSTALTTVGAAVTRKLGDIKNSQTFKSMEEKVATGYASVKSKVRGSQSTEDIDAALLEAKERDEDVDDDTTELITSNISLATEKVPL